MQPDEPLDPITTQLRRAAEQKRKDRDAWQGEQLLSADFSEQARKAAPRELEKIEGIIRQRAISINAIPIPGVPRLTFEKTSSGS